MTDRDKLIEDYKSAYLAANGWSPVVRYNRGWYSVDGSPRGGRASDLAAWTENLRARVDRMKETSNAI